MNERNYPSCVILIVLLISLLTSVLVPYDMLEVTEISDNEYQVNFTTSYTPHVPIIISNNSDFVSQGWIGNGTVDEPYLIENLSITDQSECIMISNTDVYFEIRACLFSASSELGERAVMLENVTHGMVRDCIIEKHNYGIILSFSSNCFLTNNTATSSFWGYYLVSSSFITLINNTVSDCDYGFTSYLSSCTMANNTARHNDHGYHLYEASFCNLTDNLALDNIYGFHLYHSNSCSLVNNTSYENSDSDFHLYYSSSCKLIGNSGWRDGLFIMGSSIFHWIHDISGNTVRNQYIGYFKSISNMTIDGEQYGQIVLVNCSFITLKNGMFNSLATGILLGYCTSCTITNTSVMNNSYEGCILWYSPMCILSNNIATSNHDGGFHIRFSPNCTLTNNTARRNGWRGFYCYNSSSSTFTYNTAINNTISGYSIENSAYCTLTNNTAHNSGIGFSLTISDSCVLTNNTSSESNCGFSLFVSTSCILTKNIVMNNSYGINLSFNCTDNLIFLNKIFSNSVYNGKDDGFSNSWDNGTDGNYWDDWDGTGIYGVLGSAGSVDNHPHFYGVVPSDNPITTPTSTTTTTTIITTTASKPGSLVELLIAGISVVSATVIGVVLLMLIHARRAAKTAET